MSTATVFPEPETAAPETPPAPDPAPESAPRESSTLEPAPWQATVLGLLAQGASVTDAMRHVGYSSAAFYKTGRHHPEFRTAATHARTAYRAQVAEEFHNAEAYARMLVDSVMRDEQLPASLRLRAALTILNRKGEHWLPMSIPVLEDTVDTVDSMDIAGSVDTVDNTDTVDSVDTVEPTDSVDNMDTVDAMGTADIVDSMDNMDNLAGSACRQFLAAKNQQWSPQGIPPCAARTQSNPPSLSPHPRTKWTP